MEVRKRGKIFKKHNKFQQNKKMITKENGDRKETNRQRK